VNAEVEGFEKAGAAEHRGRVASARRGVDEIAGPIVFPGADRDVERAAKAGRAADQSSRRDFNVPPKRNPLPSGQSNRDGGEVCSGIDHERYREIIAVLAADTEPDARAVTSDWTSVVLLKGYAELHGTR
jgi:hypothetical protein